LSAARTDPRPESFWPSEEPKPFLLIENDFQRGIWDMTKKIDIAAIPELGTSVGIHGAIKQQEVAGPLCLGIVIAVFMAITP
jgi:hypothetical protein